MMTRALQQSSEFLATLKLAGLDHRVLQDGTLVQKQRSFGIPLALISRAYLDWSRLDLSAVGLSRHIVLINAETQDNSPARLGAIPLISPATIAELPLTGNLRAGLRQKWRNRLAKVERSDIRITRQNMPNQIDHWLLQACDRDRRYRHWPSRLTLAYLQANPGKAKLFTAHLGNAQVAAMLFLHHGNSCTYHLGHTTQAGRAFSAHTLLLWHAIQYFAQKGCKLMDLGVISTEEAPGLARFKLGTGAQGRKLGGTWVWWPPLGQLAAPLAFWDRRLMAAEKNSPQESFSKVSTETFAP